MIESLWRTRGVTHKGAPSADSSQVAYFSFAADLVPGVRDLNAADDLILYDVRARANTVVTLHAPGMASRTPDSDSYPRGLSADGRWVAFVSDAPDLTPPSAAKGSVYLYDRVTGALTRTVAGPRPGGPRGRSR